MRGRKPIPISQKIAEGNPGKRPLNRREPVAEGALGEPPEYLTDAQKGIWREAVANAPRNVLKACDASVFAKWVVAEATWRLAAEQVAKEGALIPATEGSKNLIQHPALAVQNRQAEMVAKFAGVLGFDPTSRARLAVDNGDQLELPFDDVLFNAEPTRIAK